MLFITGIPGSGKTSFGNWLQATQGYYHFDMEADLRDRHFKRLWSDGFDTDDYSAFIAEVQKLGSEVVLTWGYPEQAILLAKRTARLGVLSFWFGGDLETARRAWLRRERLPEDYERTSLFEVICGQFTESDVVDVFGDRIVCAVTGAGHTTPEEIWSQIQANCGSS